METFSLLLLTQICMILRNFCLISEHLLRLASNCSKYLTFIDYPVPPKTARLQVMRISDLVGDFNSLIIASGHIFPKKQFLRWRSLNGLCTFRVLSLEVIPVHSFHPRYSLSLVVSEHLKAMVMRVKVSNSHRSNRTMSSFGFSE